MGLLDGRYTGTAKPDWHRVLGHQSPRRVVFRILLLVVVLLLVIWRLTRH